MEFVNREPSTEIPDPSDLKTRLRLQAEKIRAARRLESDEARADLYEEIANQYADLKLISRSMSFFALAAELKGETPKLIGANFTHAGDGFTWTALGRNLNRNVAMKSATTAEIARLKGRFSDAGKAGVTSGDYHLMAGDFDKAAEAYETAATDYRTAGYECPNDGVSSGTHFVTAADLETRSSQLQAIVSLVSQHNRSLASETITL